MIQRWIGEGIVMEDIVAQEHLEELLSRGLIEVGERSHTGRVKVCRMHLFVWDFCLSKAQEEGFACSLYINRVWYIGYEATIKKTLKFRRLCIYSGGRCSDKPRGSIISSLVQMSPQLISMCFGDDLNVDQSEAVVLILKKLRLVKVLMLPCIIWSLLDESGREKMGELVHLTFLKLVGLWELPKSLGNLRCLQTLNLERCSHTCKIPNSVWGLEQLRHLYLPKGGSVCESSRQQVGDFSNLQTLVNFPPINFDLQQNLFKFSNVRKLVITTRSIGGMDRILRSQDIVFNRLQSLSFFNMFNEGEIDLEAFTRACPHLYRLSVEGSIKFPAAPSCTSIWPPNLTKLVLTYTKMDESQLGSLAKLQSLQVLFLKWGAFAGKEMVFHTNDFPQLHHLNIEGLHHLETWAVHEGALSNLLCLEIDSCRELESVPDGSQHLNQLKELKVQGMPSGFRERLERGGEDWDRVSHVPSISFTDCGWDMPETEAEEDTYQS